MKFECIVKSITKIIEFKELNRIIVSSLKKKKKRNITMAAERFFNYVAQVIFQLKNLENAIGSVPFKKIWCWENKSLKLA